MALKPFAAIVALAIVAAACSRSAPAPSSAEALEPVSVTRWTSKTELFVEYPPLALGSTSRFAVHLTRLDTFEPLTDGLVEVHLSGGSTPAEVFRVDAPSRPGIFGIDVTPAHAGRRELSIVLRAQGIDDEHRVGPVDIYDTEAAARAAIEAEDELAGTSFLKEQQWALDFGTALVAERSLRETMRVPAQIVARPGGAADVIAPIEGRLALVLDVALGAEVRQGQELARLLPPPSAPTELPQLRQAQSEAGSALDLATRDRERAERLVTAGAAPQKRLDEARATESQAQARLTASDARLAQYDVARTAAGGTNADGLFLLRAPVSGVIALRDAAAGANVNRGALLFRVVDARRVHVVGSVPEVDVVRAKTATNAELELPGHPSRIPVGQFASVGRVLDPRTRAIPIIFAVDNTALGLPIGQAVFLHLLMDPTPPGPVVPASALVDDAGRPLVFVQREGETFERRAVTLGTREGNLVQVLEGVTPGERIVTKGAYLIRLASLSSQVPAHGHIH